MSNNWTNAKEVFTRPEEQLLLACARTTLDATTREQIKSLITQHEIDWEYLRQLSFPQGMIPLLFWNLDRTCPELIPAEWLAELRYQFTHIVQDNLFLTSELVKLLEIFQAQGIPALPFKGPVLAATAYRNVSLRQYGDIDILVKEKDVVKALDILTSLGYRILMDVTNEEAGILIPEKKDFKLVGRDGRVFIELHWRFTGKRFPFSLDLDELWNHLVTVDIAGKKVSNLNDEDLLLILCVHGSKHLWERLMWICDIAEIIRSSKSLDWARLMKSAHQHGCRRMLLLGLRLAHDLLSVALPPEVEREMRADPIVRDLAIQSAQLLTMNPRPPQPLMEKYVFHIRMRERVKDKLALMYYYGIDYYHLAVTPNKQDKDALSLPGSLSTLYYLVRPVRLSLLYSSLLFKSLKRESIGRRPPV